MPSEKLVLHPPASIDVTARIPGSKSLTNRALICAALAEGESILSRPSFSDDSRSLAGALRQLGILVEEDPVQDRIRVLGKAGFDIRSGDFRLGNSGTAVRFFTSYLCTGQGTFVVDGDERMRQRPIGGLVEALCQLGCDVRYGKTRGFPPLVIQAGGIKGGQAVIRGETSSQFLSSLLLSAPAAQGEILLDVEGEAVSRPYVDMTLEVMRCFGVSVDRRDRERFRVYPERKYRPHHFRVEADAAGAGYLLAMAAVSGGRVRVEGIGSGCSQAEFSFIPILEHMGCRVVCESDAVTVIGGPLRGVEVDLNGAPDSVQTLACVALFAKGRTHIRNVRNLRVKETDRLAALATELRKFGAEVVEHEDGIEIVPPERVRPAEVETYRDHRMALSFSVIAAAVPGVCVRDPGCVSKSFPGFYTALQSVGFTIS